MTFLLLLGSQLPRHLACLLTHLLVTVVQGIFHIDFHLRREVTRQHRSLLRLQTLGKMPIKNYLEIALQLLGVRQGKSTGIFVHTFCTFSRRCRCSRVH